MKSDQYDARDLPQGWVECPLGQVTLPVKKIDPKKEPDRKIDYIDISGIDNSRHVIGNVKPYRLKDAPSRARQVVRSGDVLFATVRPYLRNIATVPKEFDEQIASTGFSVLRAALGICPAFLFYKTISNDFVNALTGIQYGVSYPAVKDKDVREQLLGIPPSREQLRIVSKIEELFSELDKGIESLKTARAQLKVYRQAVLKHAFEGKLTARWREDNKGTLEVVPQLLTRVKREREARYEQQLHEWKVAVDKWEKCGSIGDRPVRPRRPRSLPDTPPSKRTNLPQLPRGWVWARLGNISIVSGGLTKNPGRTKLPRKMKYLRVANVYADRVLTNDICEIGVTDSEARAVTLQTGDVLIVEGNGSINQIGRVAQWNGELPHCGHQNHLIRTRFTGGIIPRFFLQFLLSPLGRDLIIKEASSTSGLHTLSISKVSNLFVPVAPSAEQSAVVDRIEERVSKVDKAIGDIESQLLLSEALRQSILKRAFSGELVEQDPNDEPATVLLERIKTEEVSTLSAKARQRRVDSA